MRRLKLKDIFIASLLVQPSFSSIVEARNEVMVREDIQFAVSDSTRPYIPDSESYPDGAYIKAQKEELEEIKRTENAKDQAARAEQEYEQHKKDIEREIQAKNRKIEDAKIEQVKLKKEQETFDADIVQMKANKEKLDKEYTTTKEDFNRVYQEFLAVKTEFDKKKAEYQQQERVTNSAERDSDTKIHNMQIEMERMRRDVATTEGEISRSLNKKSHIEAELTRVRLEHEDVATELEGVRKKRGDAADDLRQTTQQLAKQQNEISEQRRELASLKAETARMDAQAGKNRSTLLAEAKKLEYQIAENNSARIAYEADKVKMEAENDRLQTALASARARNDAAQMAAEQDHSLVLESRIKSEKTKTEISRLDSTTKKMKYENDNLKVKVRAMASLADNSGMDSACFPGPFFILGRKYQIDVEQATDSTDS